MLCPKCKTTELFPTKLESALPALGCNQCHGTLISLLHFRDWVERGLAHHCELEEDAQDKIEAIEDSKAALHCPKCGKIMRKFRINGKQDNRLDLCASCDDAWVDGGEWQLLKSLQLSDCIPKIFTEHWQKRVRNEATEESKKARFTKILGEADFETANAFRQWLKTHPKRQEILFFCNDVSK